MTDECCPYWVLLDAEAQDDTAPPHLRDTPSPRLSLKKTEVAFDWWYPCHHDIVQPLERQSVELVVVEFLVEFESQVPHAQAYQPWPKNGLRGKLC